MPHGDWQPTQLLRFVEARSTGASVVRVKTDRGDAFLKALGNASGPHALAREWVGTQLADLYGLPTFHFALYTIKIDDIPLLLANGRYAESGPAFLAKYEVGQVWGPGSKSGNEQGRTGVDDTLKELVNPEMIPRLAVFDTWVRNRDRHPPVGSARKPNWDNVYLSAEGVPGGKFRLIAMDHSHVFSDSQDLSPQLANIDAWKDDAIYGVFPEFRPFIEGNSAQVRQCLDSLRALPHADIRRIVYSIPSEWQVDRATQAALLHFLCNRARYVSDTRFAGFCPQSELLLNNP